MGVLPLIGRDFVYRVGWDNTQGPMNAVIFYSSFAVSVAFVGYAWPMGMRMFIWDRYHSAKQWLMIVGLYAILGYFQFAQHYLATFGTSGIWFGWSLNAGSSLLFPLSLAALLYLYIAGGAGAFRAVCLFLLAVNGLIVIATCLLRAGWLALNLPPGWEPLYSRVATYGIALGTALLLFDAFLMAWCYRAFKTRTQYQSLRLLVPLLLALTFDAVTFSAVVAVLRDQPYFAVVGPQLASKLVVGAIYAFCLAWYFRQWEPKQLRKKPVALSRFFGEVLAGGVFGLTFSPGFATRPVLPVQTTGRLKEGSMPSAKLLRDFHTPLAAKEYVILMGLESEQQREMALRTFMMSYYFGGLEVAYKESDCGPVILASGPSHEVAAELDKMDPADVSQVILLFPERLESLLRDLDGLEATVTTRR